MSKLAKERRVTLPILGAESEVVLPVPGGRGGLTGVLPAFRKLSAAMMSIAEAEQRKAGAKVSCRAGCDHCCRQLIPTSIVEAQAVANAVARMPSAKQKAVRKRFDQALTRLEQAGLLAPRGEVPRAELVFDAGEPDPWDALNARYVALRLDCPLLENGRCMIYEERPFACREYLVTSDPSLCRDLDPSIDAVPRPAYTTRTLADVVIELEGISPGAVPMLLALEWIEGHGGALGKEHDLAEVLDIALASISWNEEVVVVDERDTI